MLRRARLPLLAACVSVFLGASPAAGWVELPYDFEERITGNPIPVVDGSYFMSAGNLHINITNIGIIGSLYSSRLRMSDAPSAQWPAGSGNEYLWAAGLWVGGVLLGERLVSTGVFDFGEIRAQPNPEDTIYEAIGARLVRPAGNTIASGRRFPEPNPNDDDDADEFGNPRIDEETLNGYDDDGDGLIDEDFAQIGNQMMVTTMYDNTRFSIENNPDHTPLNLKIVQSSYAWENQQVRDFVGFDYTITNIGVTDITNIYIGMFADCDIGPREVSGASDDMAGSFSGAVRASDGSWVPVEVGYMWDAAEEQRLDGYFGVAFLGHDTDPTGRRAPRTVSLRAFRHFSGQAPYDQGGDPVNDEQRYEVLSTPKRDSNVQSGKEEDYRFLVSAGPFERLQPDEDLTFQIAMVVGPGLDGLLRNCAEAMLTFYGNWFDTIPPQPSVADRSRPLPIGVQGRETMICQEDFDPTTWNQIYPDFGDMSCAPSQAWLADRFERITNEDLFWYKRDPANPARESICVMVNLDNCFECFRQKPHIFGELPEDAPCSEADLENYWNCWDDRVADTQKAGCTGVGGRETQIKWLVGMAPPPPGMRVWPTDREVHVFWDNRSEITPDVRLNVIDFESYRVWRADNWTRPFGSDINTGPGSGLWQLIAEYDVPSSYIIVHQIRDGSLIRTVFDTLPLGRNTGLDDIRYTPRILDDSRFDGLREAMQQVAANDPAGLFNEELPSLFDRFGAPREETLPLLPWQGYRDALDTFWAVTERAEVVEEDEEGFPAVTVVAKEPRWYYEYIDRNVHNGYLYFYSVTATDHELQQIPDSNPPVLGILGPGLIGDPSSSFTFTSPATSAQTAAERARDGANIFVYPNPATRHTLSEFQQLSPSPDDPTGVRVNFANLPAARNTIKIFTLSGDLVQTIDHDGRQGYGEASWNLISRNGQEVVSGIYLYVVHSLDSGFDDFIGKFVVVR